MQVLYYSLKAVATTKMTGTVTYLHMLLQQYSPRKMETASNRTCSDGVPHPELKIKFEKDTDKGEPVLIL